MAFVGRRQRVKAAVQPASRSPIDKPFEAVRCYILSPPFQCGCQFAVSAIIISLFIFIRPITFYMSCLSALMLGVALSVLSTDNHMGTRLQASANMLGGMTWGAVLAGVVLTLAHLAAPASCTTYVGCTQHTVALCLLAVAALGLVITPRTSLRAPYSPLVWLAGLMAVMGYGMALIAGQAMLELKDIWGKAVASVVLCNVIGEGACAVSSLFVLPSMAVDEMRADTAAAIRGLGHAVGRIASRVFDPDTQHLAMRPMSATGMLAPTERKSASRPPVPPSDVPPATRAPVGSSMAGLLAGPLPVAATAAVLPLPTASPPTEVHRPTGLVRRVDVHQQHQHLGRVLPRGSLGGTEHNTKESESISELRAVSNPGGDQEHLDLDTGADPDPGRRSQEEDEQSQWRRRSLSESQVELEGERVRAVGMGEGNGCGAEGKGAAEGVGPRSASTAAAPIPIPAQTQAQARAPQTPAGFAPSPRLPPLVVPLTRGSAASAPVGGGAGPLHLSRLRDSRGTPNGTADPAWHDDGAPGTSTSPLDASAAVAGDAAAPSCGSVGAGPEGKGDYPAHPSGGGALYHYTGASPPLRSALVHGADSAHPGKSSSHPHAHGRSVTWQESFVVAADGSLQLPSHRTNPRDAPPLTCRSRRLPGVGSCPALDRLEDVQGDGSGGAPHAATSGLPPSVADSCSMYSSDDEYRQGQCSPRPAGRSGNGSIHNQNPNDHSHHLGRVSDATAVTENIFLDEEDFEQVLEDEDAFLLLLQEATAPQQALGRVLGSGGGRRRSFRRPPPAVAPPGGILPSPSAFDLLHVETSKSGIGLSAGPDNSSHHHAEQQPQPPGEKKKHERSRNRRRPEEQEAPPAPLPTAAALAAAGKEAGGLAAAGAAGALPGAGPAGAAAGGLSGATVAWAPVSAIRPLLARAKACAAAAASEPPFLMRGPADLCAWGRVLAGCEALLNRVVALECLMDDTRHGQDGHLFDEAGLTRVLGYNIVAPYRRLFGEIAASCAAMSVAVAASVEGGGRARPDGKAFEAVGSWEGTKRRLHTAVREALASYWSRVRGGDSTGPLASLQQHETGPQQQQQQPVGLLGAPLQGGHRGQRYRGASRSSTRIPIMRLHQSRALNFLWTVTESIITAMDELEAAVQQALVVVQRRQCGGGGAAAVAASAVSPAAAAAAASPSTVAVVPAPPGNGGDDGGGGGSGGGGVRPPAPSPCTLPAAPSAAYGIALGAAPTAADGFASRPSSNRSSSDTTGGGGGRGGGGSDGNTAGGSASRTTVGTGMNGRSSTSHDSDAAAAATATAAAAGPVSNHNVVPAATPTPRPAPVATAALEAPAGPLAAPRVVLQVDSGAEGGGGGEGGGRWPRRATVAGNTILSAFATAAVQQQALEEQQRQQEEGEGGRAGNGGLLSFMPPLEAQTPRTQRPFQQQPANDGGEQKHLQTGQLLKQLEKGQGWWARRWRWWCGAGGKLDHWLHGPQWDDWGWLWWLTQLCLGIPMLRNIASVTSTNAHLLLRGGPAGRSSLLSSRNFQFGAKYWLAITIVLCVILGLCARPDAGVMRQYSPLYAYLATSVSMTDRVESTFNRAAMRAGGTLLGGGIGLFVMLTPGLKSSPVAIMCVVCAVTFWTGTLCSHPYVYGASLSVITLMSMVMCQWGTSCYQVLGDGANLFAARVVSVLLGCTLPVLFTHAVLPWFTSDAALETMSRACLASAALVRQLYRRYYEEHMQAHRASRGLEATLELLRQHGLEEDVERLVWEAAEEQRRGMQEREQREEREQGGKQRGQQQEEEGRAGGQQQGVQEQQQQQPNLRSHEQQVQPQGGHFSQQCIQPVAGVLSSPAEPVTPAAAAAAYPHPSPLAPHPSLPLPHLYPHPHPSPHLLHSHPSLPLPLRLHPRLIELQSGVQRQGSLQLAALAAEVSLTGQLQAGGSAADGPADLEAVRAATEETAAAVEAAVKDSAAGARGAEASKVAADQAMEVTLQAHVSGPLVTVQTSLMKDVAVWTRGFYATPAIVAAMLRCCLLLSDRLSALQLVVADTPPPVYGRLSGWAFARLVLPVHKDTMAMLEAVDRVVVATSHMLDPHHRRRAPGGSGSWSAWSWLWSACCSYGAGRGVGGGSAGGSGRGQQRRGKEQGQQPGQQQQREGAGGSEAGVERRSGGRGGEEGIGGGVLLQRLSCGRPGEGRSGGRSWERGQEGGGRPPRLQEGEEEGKETANEDKEDEGKETAKEGKDDEDAALLTELRKAIHDLEQRRLQVRQHIHDMRRTFHASVRSVDEQHLPYATHPDDSVRFHAMFHALVKVMNGATAAARTVAEFRSSAAGRRRQQRSAWLSWGHQ